jgi:hypothetical protein
MGYYQKMNIPIDDFHQARQAGAEAAAKEPRAVRAWYADSRIHIELADGTILGFLACELQGLADATPAQLAAVEITPTGSGLHWADLDADLGVAGLVVGLFGSATWMKALGSLGGKSTSPAKIAAAKLNGKLGGRPKKTKSRKES